MRTTGSTTATKLYDMVQINAISFPHFSNNGYFISYIHSKSTGGPLHLPVISTRLVLLYFQYIVVVVQGPVIGNLEVEIPVTFLQKSI